MFYLRMHCLLLLYHPLLMFMHSFLLGFREITVKNSYNELYIYYHYREEWEESLPKHLQTHAWFTTYIDDATVLKRNKSWNAFLRKKNCGLYFSSKYTKPLIYCRKKFLLSFIKYSNT